MSTMVYFLICKINLSKKSNVKNPTKLIIKLILKSVWKTAVWSQRKMIKKAKFLSFDQCFLIILYSKANTAYRIYIYIYSVITYIETNKEKLYGVWLTLYNIHTYKCNYSIYYYYAEILLIVKIFLNYLAA